MALSVNKVTLLGNVGKDPEYKVTPNGTPVCKFSLATSESFKNNSDQWEERTEWHNVECWRYTADTANKHLRKGTKVYLEGKLKTESYEKDGITRYTTKVIVSELVLIQKNDNSDYNYQATPQQRYEDKPNYSPNRGNSYQTRQQTVEEFCNSDGFDDVPF